VISDFYVTNLPKVTWGIGKEDQSATKKTAERQSVILTAEHQFCTGGLSETGNTT